MLVPTIRLLQAAQDGGYAIGAFNVYILEGAKAVVAAAEAMHRPAILQIHPSALAYGGKALIDLCLTVARETAVSMAVHLDHSVNDKDILLALAANISSIMADGSHLDYAENINFTKEMVALAHAQSAAVEAELGRISGTEDGLTLSEFEARFTDPEQASDFVTRTGVDTLAVCIGNVHGRYHRPPRLDFDRLKAVQQAVNVPLVLHGASGLPDDMICRSIELGITKFNVNTEVRQAYLDDLKVILASVQKPDLLDVMRSAVQAMQAVVSAKLELFGSTGQG